MKHTSVDTLHRRELHIVNSIKKTGIAEHLAQLNVAFKACKVRALDEFRGSVDLYAQATKALVEHTRFNVESDEPSLRDVMVEIGAALNRTASNDATLFPVAAAYREIYAILCREPACAILFSKRLQEWNGEIGFRGPMRQDYIARTGDMVGEAPYQRRGSGVRAIVNRAVVQQSQGLV